MDDIRQLELVIQKANTAYYLGQPTYSDQEFDGMIRKLRALAPDSPVLNSIGEPVTGEFGKVHRDERMYSLQDVFDDDGIIAFCNKYSGPYLCEFKMDGLAIELEYVEGRLVTASTRGSDGYVGDDVTHSIRTVKNIPKVLNEVVDLTVRGEVVISKSNFKKLDGFANARNAAAGSVRQKDPAVSAERYLEFQAYSLLNYRKDINHVLNKEFLRQFGFDCVRHRIAKNAEDVINAFNALAKLRKSSDYDIDGMVVKVNSFDVCHKAGFVGKYPKWAIACKFENPAAITKLIDVVCQVGRTGNVTPVAILEPVEIAGSTVRRASLHNQSEIFRKGIYIGAQVVVEKAGEIIPEVTKVVSERNPFSDQEIYEIPDECPKCGQKLNKDFLNWRCLNQYCSIDKWIEYFASKRCMDIQGLGPSMITQLLEERLIIDPVDLYQFVSDPDFCNVVMQLDGWSDGKINKIKSSLEKSRKVTAAKFYQSLGIETIGESKSQLLAEDIPDPMDLIEGYDGSVLTCHHYLGEVSSNKLCLWIRNNREFYFRFYGEVDIKKEKVQSEPKTFLFTGKISRPRADYEEMVRDNGHKVAKSISKNVDYLVAGDKAGSKLAKAEKLGVSVINEEQFLEFIKQ